MEKALGSLSFNEHLTLSKDISQMIIELRRAGILYSEVHCSCGQAMSVQGRVDILDGQTWRCSKNSCKKRASIRKDSYFSHSNLPLGTMWMIIVCFLKFPKMLNCYLSEILDVSEHTLVNWGNFVRETISHFYLANPLILGGKHAVQVDESLFGGRRKYHRGNHHRHMKSWVFGITEETTKRCVLWPVKKRNRTTLTNIICDHVVENSTVKSDDWAAYRNLDEAGFNHLVVNHSVNFVSQDGVHTQLIESLWSQVKAGLKAKRGTSKSHLSGYLDMHSFLCDAKYQMKTPVDFFIELIQVGHCY
jgi:transposase-like protein